MDFLFSSEGFGELKWIHDDHIEDRERREKRSFARAIQPERVEAVLKKCDESGGNVEGLLGGGVGGNGNSQIGNTNTQIGHQSISSSSATKRMTTASFLPENPWGLIFGHSYSVVGVVSSRDVNGSNEGNGNINGAANTNGTAAPDSSADHDPHSHSHHLENLHNKLEDKQIELELSRQKFLEEKLGIQRKYPWPRSGH